jgi:hypothetical protein
VHIKFKDCPLNQPLIAPNNCKNSEQHSQQGVSCPGKKAHQPFLSLSFFSPNKQKSVHQSESNSATSWTRSPWKASLCGCCTEKRDFSPMASCKAACMNLQNEQVRSPTMHDSPTYPREHNPVYLLDRLNPTLPPTKPNSINSEL